DAVDGLLMIQAIHHELGHVPDCDERVPTYGRTGDDGDSAVDQRTDYAHEEPREPERSEEARTLRATKQNRAAHEAEVVVHEDRRPKNRVLETAGPKLGFDQALHLIGEADV